MVDADDTEILDSGDLEITKDITRNIKECGDPRAWWLECGDPLLFCYLFGTVFAPFLYLCFVWDSLCAILVFMF